MKKDGNISLKFLFPKTYHPKTKSNHCLHPHHTLPNTPTIPRPPRKLFPARTPKNPDHFVRPLKTPDHAPSRNAPLPEPKEVRRISVMRQTRPRIGKSRRLRAIEAVLTLPRQTCVDAPRSRTLLSTDFAQERAHATQRNRRGAEKSAFPR